LSENVLPVNCYCGFVANLAISEKKYAVIFSLFIVILVG